MRLRTYAPGKLNRCLFVGEPRADGYHPLVSVFEAVDLADVVTLEQPTGAQTDEVVCADVDGPNLAATALARFREHTGYDGPPVRLSIDKRVPVAAGMGGGSGDAAAALRLIHAAATKAGHPVPKSTLETIAPTLGADVTFALTGGRALVTGIGEHVAELPPATPAETLVIVPLPATLSTAVVYRAADTLKTVRDPHALQAAKDDLTTRLTNGQPPPAINDLQLPARDLCPAIDAALQALNNTGARDPMVTGSGPTVFGAFATQNQAQQALQTLRRDYPNATLARPAPATITAVEALAP